MIPMLLAVGTIVLLLFVIIAGMPDEFNVMRSTTINAPADKVFPHVNNLRQWEAWSPWAKRDPNAKILCEGAPGGVGAILRWAGNKEVGQGSMTITDSRASELVRIRLEFLKPFRASNAAEFVFKSVANQTEVNWSMTGRNNFFFKAFSLFMNCDDMAGRDFEKGLAAMKSVVEAKV